MVNNLINTITLIPQIIVIPAHNIISKLDASSHLIQKFKNPRQCGLVGAAPPSSMLYDGGRSTRLISSFASFAPPLASISPF